ncbi:hypothetical protein GCM10009823_23830 [Brevibacterium salitolerans]|uniref:Uncharacterized protein n=1 Tax=Brevibacterium salitolerans TaxID=1403566 RepID=A0ABN2WXT0_9MICO
MSLWYLRSERCGQRRDERFPESTGCDDGAVCIDPLPRGKTETELARSAGKTHHRRFQLNGKVVVQCIGGQIFCYLVLTRVRPAFAGKAETGKRVITNGSEQSQRVPTSRPRMTHGR